MGPEVFLEPVPEGSARFPYILFWTVDVWAFKSIYDSTLLKFTVPARVQSPAPLLCPTHPPPVAKVHG